MKKFWAFMVALGTAAPLWAAPSGPPAGNYINNISTIPTSPAFSVSSGTFKTQVSLPFMVPGQCATTDATGKIIGVPCGNGAASIAIATGTATSFALNITSPTAVINFDSSTFNAGLKGGATAFIQLNASSVTLQGNNLSATYLTTSSATATYLQLSSATANFITKSSATATYVNKVSIIPVANGGTGITSPGLIAGTNIGSITGTWPNQTINTIATLVASSASVTTGHCAQFSTATGLIDAGASCGTGSGAGYAVQPATVAFNLAQGMSASTGVFTSSVTVLSTMTANAVAINGSGNLSVTQNNYTGQVILSTTVPTVGQFAYFTSSVTVIGASGGGTPAGSAFDVQVTSANGTQFAGYDNFQNNGSTVSFVGLSTMTVTNVSTVTATSVLFNYTSSSMTISSSTIATLNISTMTGGGLTSCSGGTSALTWNSTTKQFGCNSISGGSGSPGGNAFNVQYSSANGTQFAGSDNFTNNGSTVSFVGIATMTFTNVSSVTATGVYYNLTESTMTVSSQTVLGQLTASTGIVSVLTASSETVSGPLIISTIAAQTSRYIGLTLASTGYLSAPHSYASTFLYGAFPGMSASQDSSYLSLYASTVPYDSNFASYTGVGGGQLTGYSGDAWVVTKPSPTDGSGVVYIGAGSSAGKSPSLTVSSSAISISGTLTISSPTITGEVIFKDGTVIVSTSDLAGNQNITVTGDNTGSGTTAITLTAAPTQNNIKTFTAPITNTSSVTINTPGVNSITLSSNTILPGTTFYANAPAIFGSAPNFSSLSASLPLQLDASKNVTAAAVNLSGTQATGTMAAARMPALTGDVTTSAGAVATTMATTIASAHTFSGAISFTNAAAGILMTGAVRLASTTGAIIRAKTPAAVSEVWGCSDCATVPVCISTGTTVGSYSLITSKTTQCL